LRAGGVGHDKDRRAWLCTPLGHCLIPHCGDKGGKLRVGDLVAVDPEIGDGDFARGSLLRFLRSLPHLESPARNSNARIGWGGRAGSQDGRLTLLSAGSKH
jgi:hypothetical protein